LELIAKTGERVPVEVSGKLMQYEGSPAVLVIVRDIRERKGMEEARQRLEKLATIGELATMVGHDLRNPLQAIQNAAYYLKNECAFKHPDLVPPQAKEMLQAIDDSIHYADKIVRDLQDFSSIRKPDFEKMDINTMVKEILSHVKVPENVELHVELSNLPKIEADEDQVKRVFLNLIENGIQAMENGGRLTVSTRQTGDFVEISFKDTGIGILKENMDNVFKPLFTTKAKGMGMGLPICKKFVEGHCGSIQVESEVDKGATFTVKLPIGQEKTSSGGPRS
jgi:signal transduction histidine kinase